MSKKGRGKAKGSAFERKICKFLSRWINPDSKEVYFWRSAGSGSVFTTSKGAVGGDFSGDIYAVSEEGEFLTKSWSIECKDGYPDYSIDSHLKNNKSDELNGFWEQCVNDAILSNKKPMLIFKKKYLHPWVCIDGDTYLNLENELNCLPYINLRYIMINVEKPWFNELYMFDMEDFFKIITPKIIKEVFK